MDRIVSSFLTRHVRIPVWGVRDVEPALAGDPDAAASLIYALNEGDRGVAVFALWLDGVGAPALRAAFDAAWSGRHGHVLAAFGERRLRAFLSFVEFDVSHLPATVTLYRGVSGIPIEVARRGCSWTTSRSVAAWFACRWSSGDSRHRPLVFTATVRRSRVLYWCDGRSEQECLVMGCRNAVPDPQADEWQAVADAWKAEQQAAEEARREAWTVAATAAARTSTPSSTGESAAIPRNQF